jgi:hypothetical protein
MVLERGDFGSGPAADKTPDGIPQAESGNAEHQIRGVQAEILIPALMTEMGSSEPEYGGTAESVEHRYLGFLSFETDFGGVFYLINLGLFLDLYGDFTTPLEPGIELSIWDFIALLGRELAGEAIESDGVWPALARLAGRSTDQSPGADYTWIDCLMPYIRARLRLALGLDDLRDISDVLIRHHAQARVTDTHVDVFFSLADLPIEVRLSGLDRDPGWVPAAGRYIAFHYD